MIFFRICVQTEFVKDLIDCLLVTGQEFPARLRSDADSVSPEYLRRIVFGIHGDRNQPNVLTDALPETFLQLFKYRDRHSAYTAASGIK